MSAFKTKIFGIAAFATAFAGLTFAQAPPVVCPQPATNNPTLRQEGQTELVADGIYACTNSGPQVTGAAYATLSAPVTSKSASTASGGGAFAGNSDIVLIVTNTAVAPNTNVVYPGTVAGATVSFNNVIFPATTFTLDFANVRVNASASGNPQVTEGLILTYPFAASPTGTANTTVTAFNVGYILPSMSWALQQINGGNQFFAGNGTTIQTCAGTSIPNPVTATSPAFTLIVKELTANAFKIQGGTAASTGENGSFVALNTANLATNTGVSTQATALSVNFTNIPSSATVYLPIQVTSNNTTLTLQGSPTAVTSPGGLNGLGYFNFQPNSSGVINAIYQTTSTGATSGTSFNIPVYLNIGGASAPVQTTPMTVQVTYSPTATVTGPTAFIPTFVAPTATPTNTFTITPCTTTLLFPYVTNVSGFETGIAIANTTTDNLKSSGSSSITPAVGTCKLDFYGSSATQPTQVVTGNIGVASATGTQTPVWANILSLMEPTGTAAITNFTGYAIANCNFLDAHGFTFILANPGTTSQAAEGYLAVTLPSSRAGGGDGTNTGN